MDDLKLWNDLATRSADDPELGKQILEFEADRANGKKKADRWVYVGDFIRILPRQSEEVQAAILRILVGMLGQSAIEAVVDRINADVSLPIANQAANTLVKNGPRFQWQLVHAFFSSNKAIRSLAPSLIDSSITASMGLHLLVDDEFRPELLPKLYGIKLPAESIDTIFQFWATDIVSAQQAQWLMAGISDDAMVAAIETDTVKLGFPMKLLDQLYVEDQHSSLIEEATHHLKLAHWIFDLHCNPDLRALSPHGVDVGANWVQSMYTVCNKQSHYTPAFVLALLLWLHKQPEMPQPIVNLLMYLDLRTSTLKWISKAKRREALTSLYSIPFHKDHPQADVALKLLKETTLTRRESGQLDLAVIGSLVRCISSPTETFEALFSKEQVVAAFLESPEESMAFFEAPLSTKYICNVLNVLWKQGNGKKNRIRTCAMLALNVPSTRMGILDDLESAQWSNLLTEALRIVDASASSFPQKRIGLLAKQLCFRLKSQFDSTLVAILDFEAPHKNQLGVELFDELSRNTPAATIVAFVKRLVESELEKFLTLVDHASGIPVALERLLVDDLQRSKVTAATSWAQEKLASLKLKPTGQKTAVTGTARLTPAEADAIANCAESDLHSNMGPALKAPSFGVVAALERRKPPTKSNIQVLCALAACRDSLPGVDRLANQYTGSDSDGSNDLKRTVNSQWMNNSALPLIGNAFIHLWEYHLFEVDAAIDRLANLTEIASELKTPIFAEVLWRTASRLVDVQAARNKERYYQLISPAFVESCVFELRGTYGEIAAAILVRAFLTRESDVEHHRNEVTEMIPSLPKEVRKILGRWVSVEGLTTAKRIERGRAATKIEESLRNKIGSSSAIAQLKRWCSDTNWKIANAAAQRLLELRGEGVEALLEVLVFQPLIPRFDIVAETIPWFDSSLPETADALDILREMAIARSSSPFRRFMLASQLLQTDQLYNDFELIGSLVEATQNGGELQWFVSDDWNSSLIAVKEAMDELDFAILVATSNQSQAYLKAVSFLISGRKLGKRHIAAVEDFLRCGSKRAYDLRIAAAQWLRAEESSVGLPLIAAHLNDDSTVLSQSSFEEVQRLAYSAVAKGCRETEQAIIQSLRRSETLTEEQQTRILEWLVANAGHVSTIDSAVPSLGYEGRISKLTQVARTFKWGINQALELLGQKFNISMLTDSDLGYTRLNENKVFVNILPIMEGRQNGQKVVEGLILHELGHHIYHKGRANQKIWKKAQRKGLHGLLNIVSDEHLERNLRTKDSKYDSRLKQLASFAFQHTKKDFGVQSLLQLLNVRALEVLSQIKLGVTDSPVRVRVDSGQLLRHLESAGSSFSRFFRALRMGLGNRYNDPKVEEALKLFNRSFRKSNMRQLYEITLKLKEIFQDDCGFTNFISQDGLLHPSELERARAGRGMTDEQIDQEIRRITSREELERSKASEGTTGGRAINVIDEIDFTPINNVIKAPFNREAARELSQTVVSSAKMLRNYLQDLGEMHVQQRRRLSGYRLDRQAVNRLVTRQDPRMMISRRREFKNDLFIGVAIDCSGSMAYNENIELAKRFAALLAESTRDVDGIDLKLIGFTDDTIFDVGGNQRNAIHTLQAGGGNNDAAALWHMAQEALRSKRKSRLLVMISDGLPTECSVESLRTLVRKLTQNFGISCAQLAVEELEEVCFPDYVLVKSSSETAAIRKFGATIAKLIRKTISG